MPAHAAPQPAETQPVFHRIAFIDTAIHDYRSIVDSIEAGIEVILVDGQADGVAQIAAALSGRSGIEAVHIFSHGSEGQVHLGSAHLNIDSIGAHGGNLATIGAALAPDADILLYGCDVGAGTRGVALLDALALATGADVAASADLTGNAALGGNWVLERSSGAITAGSPFGTSPPAFGGALASVSFDGSEPGYYEQQSITKQVDDVAFSFGMRDPAMPIGYDVRGLYAYDGISDDDVELVISVADGYTFDIGSMQAYGDAPDTVEEDRDITFTITRADNSVSRFTYTLGQDGQLVTIRGFSTAINDVTSVVLSANRYVVFNNFEITDVKPIGPADTTAPSITGVSIPDQPMKIGSIVTATIQVGTDSDAYTLGAGSSIGGYALGNLQKVNDSTWTATFTVTAGSPDVAAGAGIPVSLVLRDSAGNASTAYTAPIVQAGDPIDANPPAPATVQLTGADDSGWSNTDGVTRVVQPALAGTAEASSTVTLNIGGVDVATGIAVDASDKWSYTPVAPLADGTYAIKALATDAAGNKGGYGSPVTIRIDTGAPAGTATLVMFSSDTGSSASDLVTNQAAQTIAGMLSAALAADERVLVSLDNGAHWQQAASTTGGSSWALAGQFLASSDTMQVKVVDQAGNEGPVAAFAYVFDTVAPTTSVGAIALSADTGNSSTDFVTRTGAQTVSATLSAPLGAGEVLYGSTNGGAIWTDISASVSGTALSWATTLVSGSNGLAFKIMDQAGNAGAVATRAYTLDTTAPAASLAAIAFSADNGASSTDLITNVAAQTISGTLTADLAAGEGVMVSLDNGSSWTFAATDGARAWSLAGQTLAGSGTLVVRVADAAGNLGPVVSRAYVLDTTAPTTVVGALGISADTGSAPDDFITNVAAQTVSATLSVPLAAGDSLLASVDGGAHWTDISAMVDGANVAWTGATLVPGAGTLQFKVIDPAGNAGPVSSRAYTLDTVAPAALATGLTFSADSGASATDLVTNTAAQTLGGTLDRATDAGDAVRVSLDNGAHWSWAGHVAGSTGWSLAGQVLSHSDTVLVQVVDAAGNAGPLLSRGYVLDLAAPAAPEAPVLAAASDSGVAGDGITSVDRPVLGGRAEALAQVTVYDTDGSTVIGSTRADADGAWEITATQLARGAHTITVRQADVAGNVSDAGAPLVLTIEGSATPTPPTQPTTPTPPTTPPTTPPLVDGVPVQVAQVTLPGGVMGTAISVPVVIATRTDTSGQSGVADIPLASGGGATLLLAQLATGYGLSASGASVGMANGLEFLIASIKAATPNHAAADQGHLTGNGEAFLAGLASTGALLVQTVKPVSAATAGGTLTLSGPAASLADAPSVALVIDTAGIGAGSTIALKEVDFAAVIGSANVVATGTMVLSGDAAGQQFTVAARDASSVFAGGGSDTLALAVPVATASAAAGAADAQVRAMVQPATTLLHGGQDGDVVVLAGARADYTVEQHNGYLMVASTDAPDAKAMVVNVEKLQFSDGSVDIDNIAEMDILAGMYQTVLGRQADVGGIAFWADGLQAGTGWGRTVLDFIASAGSETSHGGMTGEAGHDLALLYSALLERAPDAAGLAFWTAALDSGVTLESIAAQFVQSVEMVGHQRAALEWDFLV